MLQTITLQFGMMTHYSTGWEFGNISVLAVSTSLHVLLREFLDISDIMQYNLARLA